MCAAQPGTPFWEVYRLFNIKDLRFDGVYWKAAAYQAPKAGPQPPSRSPCCAPRSLLARAVSMLAHRPCRPEHCHIQELPLLGAGPPPALPECDCHTGRFKLEERASVLLPTVRPHGELLGQVLALFFVAAFGSSLDVAAIQSESPEPLDFNHELQTVGASPRVQQFSGLACLLLFELGLRAPDWHAVTHKLAWRVPTGMLPAAVFGQTLTSLPERPGLCMRRTRLRMPATACRRRRLSGHSSAAAARRAVQHHHLADGRGPDRLLHLLADHLQHARRRAYAPARVDHRRRGRRGQAGALCITFLRSLRASVSVPDLTTLQSAVIEI